MSGLDGDKKLLKGKCPKCGKKKPSSRAATTSRGKKPKDFLAEEMRKSNEKLMEDIRKAVNSLNGKTGELKDTQKLGCSNS